MSKFFLFFLVLVVMGGVVLAVKNDPKIAQDPTRIFYYFPCDKPIHYRIAAIDPRFNISYDQLQADLLQAEQVWESALGKNIFVYNPQGKLSINMVYDTRQSLTSKVGDLENQLQGAENSIKPEIEEYKRRANAFDNTMAEFNKEVEYWNSRGGAPQNEYNALKKKQEEIAQEAAQLNAMSKSLNMATDQYNLTVGEFNDTVTTLKQELSVRPEEGVYDSGENKIDIYITKSTNELIHTLAHELGHAMGIPHVESEGAIMHPYTNEFISPNADDIAALQEVCRKRTFVEVVSKRWANIVYVFQN